jgi:hypothetical protein
LAGGTVPTGRGDIGLESVLSCGKDLRIVYHPIHCGDSDSLLYLLWTLQVENAGYEEITLEETEVRDGEPLPYPSSGCREIG